MAINATEMHIIANLIDKARLKFGDVRVLSIGYPDLLMTPSQLEAILGEGAVKDIGIREDSEQVARDHSREILLQGVFESKDTFRALGSQLDILDAFSWTGEEIVCDLNFPIPNNLKGLSHIIIDPGSLEHCFNVGQAMKNISEILSVGGYIYHQNPVTFVNHGFFSFSPTFYNDYYVNNGFHIHQLCYFQGGLDKHGFEVSLKDLDLMKPMLDLKQPCTASVVVEKISSMEIVWPTQKIYGPTIRVDEA